MIKWRYPKLLTLLLLASCAPQTATQQAATTISEAALPATATQATATVTSQPRATPSTDHMPPTAGASTPEATASATPQTQETWVATTPPPVPTSGRTDDGAYFMGREDAPLTMIDYSDFL